MGKNTNRYFIKNAIFLGILYAAFFFVFNIAFSLDLNIFKTFCSAIFFSIIMTIFNTNAELKNYRRMKRSEISLQSIIPSSEDTIQGIGLMTIEEAKECLSKSRFIEDKSSVAYLRYTTPTDWKNTIPTYILISEKDGKLNVKVYKFTRTSFIEPLKPEKILREVESFLNSCS